MHKEFDCSWLPDGLVAALGRCGSPSLLAQHIASLNLSAHLLAHHGDGQPLPVSSPNNGIDLMLQCSNPEAASSERLWGIASASLQTDKFLGQWPKNLNGSQATMADAIVVFGPPEMTGGGIALFEAKGPQGQRWCVHCQFGSDNASLRMLTLARMGDWKPLPEPRAESVSLPSLETRKVVPQEVQSPATPAVITCASSGIVPKTGWYEALLPTNHPGYAYFSRSQGRFVRKHEGERMLTLGVVPFADEALVVWTWLRER